MTIFNQFQPFLTVFNSFKPFWTAFDCFKLFSTIFNLFQPLKSVSKNACSTPFQPFFKVFNHFQLFDIGATICNRLEIYFLPYVGFFFIDYILCEHSYTKQYSYFWFCRFLVVIDKIVFYYDRIDHVVRLDLVW